MPTGQDGGWSNGWDGDDELLQSSYGLDILGHICGCVAGCCFALKYLFGLEGFSDESC